MTLTQAQTQQLADFRYWVEHLVSADGRFGEPERSDREDGSTLTTRWSVAEDLHLEVSLRPLIPQVRVGMVTDDRWKSEEIEQAIQDSGDSMSEYLELAFSEVGLDWEEPPVEHYRHEGKWFSFVTPLELPSLDALNDRPVRDQIAQMIRGYTNSYGNL